PPPATSCTTRPTRTVPATAAARVCASACCATHRADHGCPVAAPDRVAYRADVRHAWGKLLPTALLCTALVGTGAVTGCSGGSPDTPDRPPKSSTPEAVPSTPVEVCVSRVAYWALEDLSGSYWAGLDWEQKGLTNQQRILLDDIVKAARTVKKDKGLKAAKAFADDLARRECKRTDGATGDSENWRQPPKVK
ncbi:hypothetical protein P8605_06100, partial [Streptomyces sp. T-3]|nr:hypothetical protein [Streptomyces sp. T-3]